MRTKCQRLKGKLGETVAGATQLDVMLAFCTGLVQSYSTGLVPADGFAFCLMCPASYPTLGFSSCQLTSAGPVLSSTETFHRSCTWTELPCQTMWRCFDKPSQTSWKVSEVNCGPRNNCKQLSLEKKVSHRKTNATFHTPHTVPTLLYRFKKLGVSAQWYGRRKDVTQL